MNERLAVGDPARPGCRRSGDAQPVAHDRRPAGDPQSRAVRERIAEWYASAQGLNFTQFRTMTALSKGETPGPENSIHKLVNASKLQDIASYGMDLMGAAGMVVDDDLVEAYGMFQSALLSSPSARIAGGSDEILTSSRSGCWECRPTFGSTRTSRSIRCRPATGDSGDLRNRDHHHDVVAGHSAGLMASCPIGTEASDMNELAAGTARRPTATSGMTNVRWRIFFHFGEPSRSTTSIAHPFRSPCR